MILNKLKHILSEMNGILFNVQKFSLHDGPGLRTVLFLTGCPLYCKWCSNPESQQAEPITADEKGNKTCDSRQYTVEEILRISLQDRPFYEESGGGITLSGGEPLAQPDFVVALLDAFRKEGLHTALETSGHAPPEVFNRVSSISDLILFDIKHYDSNRHAEGTGVKNNLILENLKSALDRKIPVLPRLPVIPGYNDSKEDARGFVSLLRSMSLDRVQLLPFHQLGEGKYETLNMPYAMKGVPQLHGEDLEEFKRTITDAGIECFL